MTCMLRQNSRLVSQDEALAQGRGTRRSLLLLIKIHTEDGNEQDDEVAGLNETEGERR